MDQETNSGIASAIKAGQQLSQHEVVELNGDHFLIQHKDKKVEKLEIFREAPRKLLETVELNSAKAFIDYVEKFGTDATVVFHNASGNFCAKLDYHEDSNSPSFCDHSAYYKPTTTSEWDSWQKNNGGYMSQTDFALFIEDMAEEIINPPSAEMMEIALTLKAKTKISFSSGIRLDNGQTQLTYHEDMDGTAGAKGELKIPEIINLGMRLYKGSNAYEMQARFRYRIKEGNVIFWYDLIRPQKTIDAAREDIAKQLREQCKASLFLEAEF